MKKLRKSLAVIVMFSMMTSFAFIPAAHAASLTNVSDTVSTSAPATSATHTLAFDTAVALDNGGYINVIFDASYTDVPTSGVTCPGTATLSVSGNTVTCTYASGLATSTGYNLVVPNVTNPSTGFYDVQIKTYLNDDSEQESALVKNAVIDTVTVTAHVDSTLTFTVSGVNTGVAINGDTTTATSTATTTPFGDLTAGTQHIVGQQLAVSTNASDGFQVTVTQNSNFDTAAGAIIDPFVDGSAVSSPTDWTSPAGTLGDNTTWGHFGVATDDDDGAGGLTAYTDGYYEGLSVGTAKTIMAHTGPSSDSEEDKGLSNIAYAVEINALQEAGDYETTLTYIATPTY